MQTIETQEQWVLYGLEKFYSDPATSGKGKINL
jgi:hypothetical protein